MTVAALGKRHLIVREVTAKYCDTIPSLDHWYEVGTFRKVLPHMSININEIPDIRSSSILSI